MEEWKSYRLGDVIKVLDYKRVPLSSKERETRKGIFPYYGAQGIIDYIDDFIFDGEYLLIAEDGENLKSQKRNIARIARGRYWVNNHAHIVESNGKCDIRYICYMLNSMDLSGYITGSAQPKLNQANLLAIELSLPELVIQKRIADLLSTFDDKIALNNRINHNLEEQAQMLYRSWFVDFEPFKSGKFEDSELGIIPQGWRVGALSDLGDIVAGGTPSKGRPEYYTDSGIAWLTPKDLSVQCNKFTAKGEIDITEEGYKNSSAKLMPRGSVLFSSRAPIGYISIAKGNICTNQGFKSVVPKFAGTAYIYYWLAENTEAIEAQASGSTFKEASGSLMKAFPALIPIKDVLDTFEKELAPILKEQEILEEQITHAEQIRDSLLPRLMSGEIDLTC